MSMEPWGIEIKRIFFWVVVVRIAQQNERPRKPRISFGEGLNAKQREERCPKNICDFLSGWPVHTNTPLLHLKNDIWKK